MELFDGDLSLTLAHRGAAVEQLRFKGLHIADRGSVQGRFANRIADGDLPLNGVHYRLLTNEKGNTLHGGPEGFAFRDWELVQESDASALCRLFSPDGDQGFPGALEVAVRYTLADNALRIAYRAVSDADTALNLTNHAFFNLNGPEGPVHGSHSLSIAADAVLDVDDALIPTGKISPVADTWLDLRTARTFTENFDYCYVLTGAAPAAVLRGLDSGITMEVLTDQPGVQLYNTAGRVCLETQGMPDAVHHPHFPSTILRAGAVFTSETVYRFSAD